MVLDGEKGREGKVRETGGDRRLKSAQKLMMGRQGTNDVPFFVKVPGTGSPFPSRLRSGIAARQPRWSE